MRASPATPILLPTAQAFITTATPATGQDRGRGGYRQNRDAATVTLAGVILSRKDRKSAKGNRYSFIQLSDRSAVYVGNRAFPTCLVNMGNCLTLVASWCC
jgi:DNA polymerase III alpha subunit